MKMEQGAIRRIVVGMDGSEQASHALDWTVRTASALGAEVIVVYAVDDPVYFGSPYAAPAQYDPNWRSEMRSELEETWCRPLAEAGVPYRAVMEDGRAATVIARVADREDADLVVVGRRGRGGVAELLLGSVSHELTLHCQRPVLLISPVQAARERTPVPAGRSGA